MIYPVGNLLACSGKSSLAGVEQGEQGGDGLFFGHGKHLRSRNLANSSKKPALCASFLPMGLLLLQLFSV
jgi:hypothetical protein